MAGSSNSEDNPIAINVTALVDIIFCLCLFFMCSLHFKQVEGKIDSWLPAKGQVGPVPKVVLEEIRILMRAAPDGSGLERRLGHRAPEPNDESLMAIVERMAADYRATGKTEVPVIIDATADVAWRDVVHLMDLCHLRRIDKIELAAPIELASK